MYGHSCVSQQATNTNFCGVCDTRKILLDVTSEVIQEELIKSYFMYGFDYQTICLFLEKFHGITISFPAGIYLFKVNIETPEQCVKSAQS